MTLNATDHHAPSDSPSSTPPPLHQTVGASSAKVSWRGSAWSLLTSTAIQSSGIAALAVVPLVATTNMPEPASRLPLPKFVSASVAPAPITPEPTRAVRAQATMKRAKTAPPRPWSKGPPVAVDWDALNELPTGPGTPFAFDGTIGFPQGSLAGIPCSPPKCAGQATPPPPSEPTPVFVGGDVRPPMKIVHVDPIYPAIAREARVQGDVILQAIIGIDGNVANLAVVHSVPLLDNAAIAAVQQWKYEPTVLNGQPVPVIMQVTIAFRLS